jgi:hypothetical protein
MGWNDRLPEDPNIPYESAQDRDDYDAWAEYVEACRIEAEAAAGGLTSQTVDPARPQLSKPDAQEIQTRTAIELLLAKFIGKEK